MNRKLLCLLGALVFASNSLFVLAQTPSELNFERCQIAHEAVARDAECAVLFRPENPDEPNGKQIELFVARIPSVAATPARDAFTVIQGGPGASSIDMAIGMHKILEPILSKRDVLIVDQRGTGRSNPLRCAESQSDTLYEDFDPEKFKEELSTCLSDLSHSDLRYYTTSVAVQDLDAVREAAGYDQLTVYGVSYGTRVAQHYLRRFPQRTRAVILDGVAHIGLNLAGGEVARRSQDAFTNLSQRCHQEPSCKSAFGDITASFEALVASLKEKPVTVTLPHPKTGKLINQQLTEFHLYGVVRMLPYSTEGIAMLPLVLHQANEGYYTPLAALVINVEGSMQNTFATGMHNSVICAEDHPFITTSDLQSSRGTYIGDRMQEVIDLSCKAWPRGEMDADFREPFDSDKPVLILSGETDPITPPENGDVAAKMFGHAQHVVVPAHGHGVIGRGCVPGLVRDFVAKGNFEEFNPNCAARERAVPFFITSTGPKP
ncbi:alpha/beta hydrolase [Arenicella chitinivorans]|uniref:alpha/beta hydrolase n=1 Tax=Arenicella chitinivorans TaxID=1329800 RepID=UPI00167307EA|nr:alpha/beta hydrolase [Arenicella chitinivorans]